MSRGSGRPGVFAAYGGGGNYGQSSNHPHYQQQEQGFWGQQQQQGFWGQQQQQDSWRQSPSRYQQHQQMGYREDHYSGGFGRHERDSLPDLRSFGYGENGFQRSQVTQEQLQRSAEGRFRDLTMQQQLAKMKQRLEEEQERSRFGQKVVTLEDDLSDLEDDPDCPTMAILKSEFDADREKDRQEAAALEKKRRKKHRHRSSSTSSSSSSSASSDNSSRRKKRDKKKKDKKKKKEKKKNRKRNHERDEVESSEQDEGPSVSKRTRKQPEQLDLFGAKLNPWVMLRKTEWLYKPSHLVVDTREDRENLNFECAARGIVPDYRPVNNADTHFWRAFSENFKGLLVEPDVTTQLKDSRYFSDRIMRNWGKRAPERRFRNRANRQQFEDMTKISHTACGEDEEGAISVGPVKREPLDAEQLANLTVDDYIHMKKSENASYAEALIFSLDKRYSILQTKVNTEPDNVDAWLEFIDIQRDYFAKQETGDPNAPIQNGKAYYEKMEMIIGEAQRKVAAKNVRAAELTLRKLKLMEDFYGVQSDAVREEWRRCENKFVNNVNMWRNNIMMRQNERSTFKLREMVTLDARDTKTSRLPLIDHCISKLVELKEGTIVSHSVMEGTEEFLVNLLVHRCRLLIVTGYIDKAVAMLQALAEFHFFRPDKFRSFRTDVKPHIRRKEMLKDFKIFWESGVQRIGEEAANGWNIFEPADREFMTPENEAETLDLQRRSLVNEQTVLVTNCVDAGKPVVEVRRQLERLMTKHFWTPVHFQHEDEGLYEHKSRIVEYAELRPILFNIEDVKNKRDLIYKLLHIFGIPIPGIEIETQEGILRHFSPEHFPSSAPNSLQLVGFDKFIENFITQIAESPDMDSPRIYTALATSVSHSGLKRRKKIEALSKSLPTIQTRQRYAKEQNLQLETSLALFLTTFEEMSDLNEEAERVQDSSIVIKADGAAEGANPVSGIRREREVCLQVLWLNLDSRNRTIWSDDTPATDEEDRKPVDMESRRKERLFFLRFAVFLARRLPFSVEPSNSRGPAPKLDPKPIKAKGRTVAFLATKREFLLSLFSTGMIGKVSENKATLEKAYARRKKLLSTPASLHLDDPYRWIGDENELVAELCSYFSHEFPINPRGKNDAFDQFLSNNSDLFDSPLFNLLKGRPSLQETRIRILQHIMAISTYYRPADLIKTLDGLIELFPHNIMFLKARLDIGRQFMKQCFLDRHPGRDDQSRLIRACGRVYAAFNYYRSELERYGEQKYGERALITATNQMIKVLKKAALENCDNALPDDYIWTFLMRVLKDGKHLVSKNIIDEIFPLGQSRCPWSKHFLMESLRGHAMPDDPFVSIVNNLLQAHGVRTYCTDAEARELMEP